MSQIVDAKGKNCPIPVIMAKKEMDGGNMDFIIEVDNQIAVQNLQKLAKDQGFSASVQEIVGGFQVQMAKEGTQADAEMGQADGSAQTNALSEDVFFINHDMIGSGSEELGTNLIRMCFFTLSEQERLPKAILFMNGGVKLAATDEQCIEHLKAMEKKGVQILVCGTCLNYFGLADHLQAGRVSNMYDITQMMQSASKVITL